LEPLETQNKWAIGFDPGKDKCGVAIMDSAGKIFSHRVIPAVTVLDHLEELLTTYPISDLVIGDQTTSNQWRSQLQAKFPTLTIHTIDERFTSQLARSRYWQMYPPRGWQRLIPRGMLTPPRAIDDLVAIILLERWKS
jgi:RNase H-fold protein (predicted Holliday junction resolvase)